MTSPSHQKYWKFASIKQSFADFIYCTLVFDKSYCCKYVSSFISALTKVIVYIIIKLRILINQKFKFLD